MAQATWLKPTLWLCSSHLAQTDIAALLKPTRLHHMQVREFELSVKRREARQNKAAMMRSAQVHASTCAHTRTQTHSRYSLFTAITRSSQQLLALRRLFSHSSPPPFPPPFPPSLPLFPSPLTLSRRQYALCTETLPSHTRRHSHAHLSLADTLSLTSLRRTLTHTHVTGSAQTRGRELRPTLRSK